MKYWLNQWMWAGLDWLFSPVCGGCNQAGYRWCPDCQKQVQSVPEPVCQNCGLPISHPGQCSRCKIANPQYEMMRSWLVFEGPIRHAMHKLKYRCNVALGNALAKHLAEYLSILGWPFDMVVPAPVGKECAKKRGYNQVRLVAKLLDLISRWRYCSRVLVRTREPRARVRWSIAKRGENISGVFLGEAAVVVKSMLLLLDEVVTPEPLFRLVQQCEWMQMRSPFMRWHLPVQLLTTV